MRAQLAHQQQLEVRLELKAMRVFSASLAKAIDMQAEILTDAMSHWDEKEILGCLNTFQRMISSEDATENIRDLEDGHIKQMAHLASFALQTIVKGILDKNIFLEEEESQ
jgi:hypothetical protein